MTVFMEGPRKVRVACDRCQKLSRMLDDFSKELDGPIYDESELQPGGKRCEGWVKLDTWAGVALGIPRCEAEGHEHWCVSCWVDMTDPEPPLTKKVPRRANRFERLALHDDSDLMPFGWKTETIHNSEHDYWQQRREEPRG